VPISEARRDCLEFRNPYGIWSVSCGSIEIVRSFGRQIAIEIVKILSKSRKFVKQKSVLRFSV